MPLDPLAEHVPDHRLRRRPHDQRLLELGARVGLDAALAVGVGRRAQPVVRDDGALLGEALDVLGLLREEGDGDEEGEVGVLHALRLDTPVEVGADAVPQRHAARLDDHAAACGSAVGQVGRRDDLLIPLREVFAPRSEAALLLLLLLLLGWRLLLRTAGLPLLQLRLCGAALLRHWRCGRRGKQGGAARARRSARAEDARSRRAQPEPAHPDGHGEREGGEQAAAALHFRPTARQSG